MELVFEMPHGTSKIVIKVLDDGSLSIRRPNKGSSDLLDKIAETLCVEELMGERADEVKRFLSQSSELDVLIGEERCG